MNLFDRASCKDCRKDRRSNVFDIGYKQNVHNVSEVWGFVTLLAVLFLGCLTRYNYRENLPRALGNTDLLHQPNAFIAERAWKDLKILTNFGPRPTGSYSNEVLSVDFLKREISYIMQMANKNQKIEMDVQVVTGAYWADFKPHGMTNVYRNVQNILVKLHGQNRNTSNALMLNCHFDSVAGSPGASDDAASCCVMLEIFRVLSRQNTLNRHSIIFLFNGAEETPLQASHGFITQHKWAKEVKAFINLESVGSGGKEVLFQAGPNHPWLVKMYGKAAAYPNGQAAAEEVFQSGLIPSDTDFRIFRDFGHVPGMDFAHVINSYRYHTKFDHIDYIPRSVLQHTGDNMLELTKLIANSDELENTEKYSEGTEVFFDVLGFFFVSYSKEFANIFNYIVVTLSIVLPYVFLSRATKGINRKHIRYEIFLGFLINVICFVAANAISYAIAYDLDRSGKSMSWYSNTALALTTYCGPTILVQCLVHLLFDSNKKAPLSLALRAQARLNGTSLFWGLLTAAITLAGYRIGYVLMAPLLITLITNFVVGVCGYQNSILKWLYVHMVGQIFVVLWTTHYYHLVVEMFIPIAGRSGSAKNPDVMIGIICCSLTFFITSYISPLIILLKRTKYFFISLLVLYVASRFYFIGSSMGFPYRDESGGSPAIQRHLITHASRTFYDKHGNIRYKDSGFWLREADRNAKKTIESLSTPEIPIPQEENILCQGEVFCGLPFHSSRLLHIGFDHLSEIIKRIIDERPPNVIDYFEEFSRNLREQKYRLVDNFMEGLFDEPRCLSRAMAIMNSLNLLPYPSEDFEFEMEESASDTATAKVLRPLMLAENVLLLQYYWSLCGFGFHSAEIFLLSYQMQKIQQHSAVQSARFWGKLFGREKCYYVAEVSLTPTEINKRMDQMKNEMRIRLTERLDGEQNECMNNPDIIPGSRWQGWPKDELDKMKIKQPPVPVPERKPKYDIPPEPVGSGTNRTTYFVCNSLTDDWIELPIVTPKQIVVARQICKCFTGNLDAEIHSYPYFPGKERHYLRAMISRITASTYISPAGYYKIKKKSEEEGEEEEELDEEDNEDLITNDALLVTNQNYKPWPIEELLKHKNWIHVRPAILNQGRIIWFDEEKALRALARLADEGEEEEEEIEEEEDEEEGDESRKKLRPEISPNLLSPISEDSFGKLTSPWIIRISFNHNLSNRITVVSSTIWPGSFTFALNNVVDTIYIGWGLKYVDRNYSPPHIPPIQEEYPLGPEIMEILDPTAKDEEEWRIAHMKPEKPQDDDDEEEDEGEEEENEED